MFHYSEKEKKGIGKGNNLFNGLLMLTGMFWTMRGGWLESLLTYLTLQLGLVKGLKLPSARLKVTSRKLASIRFASAVIFKLNLLKMVKIFCFILSAACPPHPIPSVLY